MSETNEPSTDFPLPPASFTFLVESIMMQTQMQLGIFSLGDKEENAEPNFPIAQHSIDLLAVLQDKTRGNLNTEERRMLENGLTELRFRFVQVSEESKKMRPAATVPPLAEQPIIVTADVGKGIKTS
jgi:hypothetical protein